MPRIAILGFGRIGRSLMRVALKDKKYESGASTEITAAGSV